METFTDHPSFSYVALVDKITEPQNWGKIKERFKKFQQNPKIRCLSIPVKAENKQRDKAQQISQWWEAVEQESIALSIDYDFIFETDIADCYSSIYTHSIAWAIETKETAKKIVIKTCLAILLILVFRRHSTNKQMVYHKALF